ncbi:MAG: hypothetical protein E2P02_10935 [Acidobacteria bacterium]|nr:MAG: hypothetical protein E2P02_10935 [Acidobacteriota bacterium]
MYLRRLDELEPRYVENTEGAGWVTFSHDDQWLAYFDTAKRRILKISIHGGPPTVLADPGYLPLDWRADGSLYYPARGRNRALETPEGLGISRLGPGDDAPEAVTSAEMGELDRLEAHVSPTLLPGEGHLLVSRGDGFLQTGWETGVIELDTGQWHTLSGSANQTQYTGGYWILWRDNQLWAAPLNDDFELTKPPRPVFEGVAQHPSAPLEVGEFHVGNDGSLVYIREGRTTNESTRLLLAQADGSGESEELLQIMDHRTMELVLSPQGRRVAARRCSGVGDPNTFIRDDCSIWLHTFADGQWIQLSPPGESFGYPIWDPSGEALVFSSLPRPGEGARLVRQRLEGGAIEPLMQGEPDESLIVVAVTPTGDVLLNALSRQTSHTRVLFVRQDGEVDLLREAGPGELATDLSRDERWLLLAGGIGAIHQVHLLDLEASESEPRQLTTGGGWYPVFSADEKSIYYREPNYPGRSSILQATLDLNSGRLGPPDVVAETPSVNTRYWRRVGYLSAVPKGVVFTVPQARSTGGELILVQNWLDTLPELFEEN